MKRNTVFWIILAIVGSAVFAMFALTPAATPTAVEPIIINLEIPVEQPAKFKVGDAVVVEDVPYDAKVVLAMACIDGIPWYRPLNVTRW